MVGRWLVLTLGLPIAVTPPAAAQSTDEREVIRVVESIAALSQAKNLTALDSVFAHDAWVRVIEGAGVNRGWLDYRDHHLRPELEESQEFKYRYFEIEPQIRGTVAWASFRYDVAAATPRGRAEAEGRGTAILEKRNGRWLVVHVHTSGRRKTN